MDNCLSVEETEHAALEVHPPHHPLLTWKDFFVHILTITVGLLIAIGLEQTVEAVHHHHQRAEARENLLRELSENRKTLADDLRSLAGEKKMLEVDMDVLRRLRIHQPVPPDALHFGWQWDSLDDSAWQTVRVTTVVALFSGEQVQGYNDVYTQQELVNAAALELSHQLTNSAIPLRIEPDLASLTPTEIDELLRGCAAALNQIGYVRALTDSLEPDYKQILSSF